jgi:chromosomal replication initiation ATPase DnaA
MSDPMMPLPAIGAEPTSVPPAVLLANHLKALKLPPLCASMRRSPSRQRRTGPITRAICCACANSSGSTANAGWWSAASAWLKFPHTKSFDTFDFAAQPSLNKALVLELARGEWIERRRNVIALGPSGTGKTHTALALGLAACQKGHSVAFTTAAALVHDLMEARDERRLRSLQKHLASVKLLILDELGYVPFTAVGGELLFEVLSQRYERGSTLITSNLPVRRMDIGVRLRTP